MRTCQWDKYERAELKTFLQPPSYFLCEVFCSPKQSKRPPYVLTGLTRLELSLQPA